MTTIDPFALEKLHCEQKNLFIQNELVTNDRADSWWYQTGAES